MLERLPGAPAGSLQLLTNCPRGSPSGALDPKARLTFESASRSFSPIPGVSRAHVPSMCPAGVLLPKDYAPVCSSIAHREDPCRGIDALFGGERELGEVIEDVARLGARPARRRRSAAPTGRSSTPRSSPPRASSQGSGW